MIVIIFFRKELPAGFFTEAVVKGQSTPSFHNPIDLDKYKKTSPKFDWKASKSVRIQPAKKTPAGASETSPHSYKFDGAFK